MEGLHSLLVRMSLTDETPPALATRHAIAALSLQQHGNEQAAVMHQWRSLGALQVAINALGQGNINVVQAFQAMAASMLLNVFEVSSPQLHIICRF